MPGVGTLSYCDVIQVESIIGDLAASRKFTDSTVPSTTEVETAIDTVAGEINSHLETGGYAVPVDHENFPSAFQLLKNANAFGAAAQVLLSRPAISFTEGGEPNDRGGFYFKIKKDALDLIDGRKIKAGSSGEDYFKPFSGSQQNADGDKKLPIFTRDVTDFPTSRNLTE